MTKSELIEYIKVDNAGGRKIRELNFIKNLSNIHIDIIEFHKFHYLNENFEWKQKLFNYLHDIVELPRCKRIGCDNVVKFYSHYNKYYDCCSIKCYSSNCVEKRKIGCLKKFGVDNPSKSKVLQDKKIQTCLNKYGTTHPAKSDEVKNKTKATCLKKYNVKTTLLDKTTKDKIEATNLKLYGDKNPMKSDIVKNRVNDANVLKFNKIRYVLTDEYLLSSKKINIEKVIKIFSKKLNLSPDLITTIDGDNLKIKNFCNKHNEFTISKNNLRNRLFYEVNICTECYPIDSHISIGQDEVKQFIENELKINTQKIKINGKEIDIYSPDFKLGLEYNGLYWHSENYKSEDYHVNKTNDCEKEEIKLLHIFEDEWKNKREIVKSIIKGKLGLIENKIFAEKCVVKVVPSKIAANFFEINHIHGSVNGLYKLGLFCDDELVSVMVFSKKRINNEYEILRFCNKINTQVIDSANKLLNYFIKKYQPKSIITFVDRRYSQGGLFKALGFKFIEYTDPNYWYYERNSVGKYYRKNVLKTEDFSEKVDEHQILKISDCGNIKFKMILNNSN